MKTITADMEERAQIALQTSPIPAMRLLNVERDDDTLILSGRVSTFYYKQMAQELVRSVVRDARVVNQIDVA